MALPHILKPLCIQTWTIYLLCLSQKKHMLQTNSHHENQLIILFLHLFFEFYISHRGIASYMAAYYLTIY